MTNSESPSRAETATAPVATLERQFVEIIAAEIKGRPQQVEAAAKLFAEGSTVPFVARYRKEATGGLVDEQLETLARRREYFLELTERRDAILESIASQEKLTDELEAAIRKATTKQALEDLYLPYRPKRRTRAQAARQKGLEPLADAILAAAARPEEAREPAELAAPFVDAEKGVEDADAAIAGARDILAERLSDSAANRSHLRELMRRSGKLKVRAVEGKEEAGRVYRDYFEHSETATKAPSHRLLAIFRGEREGFLVSELEIDDDREIDRLSGSWNVSLETPCGAEVRAATVDGYKRLLRPSITTDIRSELRERAEAEAIAVFRANLEALLMQSPLGQVPVLGIDPGYRTGCKLAAVDGTGKVVETGVIHVAPAPSEEAQAKAAETLERCVRDHGIRAIAIGNGTGSRETEVFTRKVISGAELGDVIVAIVPETGASVYSASRLAREELPALDVSLRGAVSIARRMQDPLAELVKIEPRSLGVGQYQHDVDQKALGRELDTAVESVVNRVGVELNTASAALLKRVSGLSDRLARSLVSHRDSNGPFRSRRTLLDVSGFGPKTFELAAGFLRIRDAEHLLDATAVHPERYDVVEAMARNRGVELGALVGDADLIGQLDFDSFADEEKGLGKFTLDDIRAELERPGRDPRPEFRAPELRQDVQSIEDIQPEMILEGRVSNVTNFGAFVDLGVKRDGLVHLSELTHRWVENALEVVQVGQIVKVKVLEVDRDRDRISLSIKALDPKPEGAGERRGGGRRRARGRGRQKQGADTHARKGGKRGGKPREGGGDPKKRPHKGAGKKPQKKKEPEKPTTLEDLLKQFAPRY